MADLTIVAADVAQVRVIEQETGPANAAITAGQPVYRVSASGKFDLADENGAAPLNNPIGVAINGATAQNDTITIIRKGLIDLGDALDGMNYGATVYLSATAGLLADADPANGVIIGTVQPAWGATTADKVLRVDL